LLDRSDLEFFRVSFAAHTHSFSLELWLKSVYRGRGDSAAMDVMAAHCDSYWLPASSTMRTACSITSVNSDLKLIQFWRPQRFSIPIPFIVSHSLPPLSAFTS
jgi:hypothetical protein